MLAKGEGESQRGGKYEGPRRRAAFLGSKVSVVSAQRDPDLRIETACAFNYDILESLVQHQIAKSFSQTSKLLLLCGFTFGLVGISRQLGYLPLKGVVEFKR